LRPSRVVFGDCVQFYVHKMSQGRALKSRVFSRFAAGPRSSSHQEGRVCASDSTAGAASPTEIESPARPGRR
jgi:hypothetical protein